MMLMIMDLHIPSVYSILPDITLPFYYYTLSRQMWNVAGENYFTVTKYFMMNKTTKQITIQGKTSHNKMNKEAITSLCHSM